MSNYYVYAIKSLKDGNLYIGMSQSPECRLKSHNNGSVNSTKSRRPFTLVYVEKVGERKEARKREKYLKTACGREKIKEKIN